MLLFAFFSKIFCYHKKIFNFVNGLGTFSYYHFMVVNGSKNDSKSSKKNNQLFYCDFCDYTTSRKSQFERHLSTAKHLKWNNGSKMVVKKFQKVPKLTPYICDCGKKYKYDSGFYRHKKTCTFLKEENKVCEDIQLKKETDYEEIINGFTNIIMKQQETIDSLIPNVGNTSITNQTNNNTNTNHFNINVFLNEKCKDAMNFNDFIDSIQLSIEDVANIGKHGQTSGFADILIEKLTSIDLYKRPLHCSDAKRETLYVKTNDEWNKESDDRAHLKSAIDHISRKGIQKVPDLDLPDEKITDTIFEIVKTPVNHKKIISKLAKEVKI